MTTPTPTTPTPTAPQPRADPPENAKHSSRSRSALVVGTPVAVALLLTLGSLFGWWGVLSVVVAILIALLIWWWFRRRKNAQGDDKRGRKRDRKRPRNQHDRGSSRFSLPAMLRRLTPGGSAGGSRRGRSAGGGSPSRGARALSAARKAGSALAAPFRRSAGKGSAVGKGSASGAGSKPTSRIRGLLGRLTGRGRRSAGTAGSADKGRRTGSKSAGGSDAKRAGLGGRLRQMAGNARRRLTRKRQSTNGANASSRKGGKPAGSRSAGKGQGFASRLRQAAGKARQRLFGPRKTSVAGGGAVPKTEGSKGSRPGAPKGAKGSPKTGPKSGPVRAGLGGRFTGRMRRLKGVISKSARDGWRTGYQEGRAGRKGGTPAAGKKPGAKPFPKIEKGNAPKPGTAPRIPGGKPVTSPRPVSTVGPRTSGDGTRRTPGSPGGGDAKVIPLFGKNPRHTQRSSGMPNPYTGAIEALGGRISTENALRVLDYVTGLPDLIEAMSLRLARDGSAYLEDFPSAPAAGQVAVSLADQMRRMHGPIQQFSKVFERVHAKELERIRNPRKGEVKWDVSKNKA